MAAVHPLAQILAVSAGPAGPPGAMATLVALAVDILAQAPRGSDPQALQRTARLASESQHALSKCIVSGTEIRDQRSEIYKT